MRLEKILPRSLGDSDSDCASIFTSLIMAAHFERSRARALGWRGLRPCASSHPAWTCRVAGSDHVFGIRFDGEQRENVPGTEGSLCGYFSLYVFPSAESPLLDKFPLSALRFALLPEYDSAIRNFSGNEPDLQPFLLGEMRINAALAGNALSLTLEAPARHRIICECGLRTQDGWLIEPGAPECDVPAFSLFLRLFAVIAATAEQQLGEKASVYRGMRAIPRLFFRADGSLAQCAQEKETLLSLCASFGSLPQTLPMLSPMHCLPARHKPKAMEQHIRPVLHVLTGFLGAGKTTFLRRWLDFLHGRERFTGVIQNEFGKVELDATLMKGDTLVEALDEGCVCCSLADSLRPGLERIISAMPAEQFVLETTGLANPANIMEELGNLRDLVTPGLVITVADALDLCKRHGENIGMGDTGIRIAQIQNADVIILNKCDAVDAHVLEKLSHHLQSLNAKALILQARFGNIPFGELDAWIDAHAKTRLPSHTPRLMRMGERAAAHEEGYEAKTIRFLRPLSVWELEDFLRSAGSGLLRAKGIIDMEGEGPCVVQYSSDQLNITPAPNELPIDLVLIGIGLHIADAGKFPIACPAQKDS